MNAQIVRCAVPWCAALFLPFLSWNAFASCGSAFCMVNTNWNVQGAWTEPGGRADLRYEYINQDRPMSGSARVGVGQIPRHHDEVQTANRNWLASFDYAFNPAWGTTVTVPVADRDHLHIHNHRGARLPENWNFTGLGDVRVLGRHQWSSEDADAARLDSYGINFGIKLPTGSIDVRNSDGTAAERSLQPGTGSTDVILGGYFMRVLGNSDLSLFAQGLHQRPINGRADYRPGTRSTLDLGLRYEMTAQLGLMLQVNVLHRGRDSGLQAEPEDTGGRSAFASAGLGYAITRDLQVYGFLQMPLYQYVNGVQLTAARSAVIGISTRF